MEVKSKFFATTETAFRPDLEYRVPVRNAAA